MYTYIVHTHTYIYEHNNNEERGQTQRAKTERLWREEKERDDIL